MQFGIDVAQQRIEWDDARRADPFRRSVRVHRRVGLRPLPADVRRGPGQLLRRDDDARRARVRPRRASGSVCSSPASRTGIRRCSPAQAMTIDHASHGRLDLSLGAAWFEPEHRALGFDVPAGRRTLRPARGHARDRHATDDRRNGVVQRAPRVAPRRADAAAARCSAASADLDRRQRPEAGIADGREVGRRVALVRAARVLRGRCRGGSTSSPRARARSGGASSGPSSLSHVGAVRRGAAQRSSSTATIGVGYLVCGWPGDGETRRRVRAEVMPDFAVHDTDVRRREPIGGNHAIDVNGVGLEVDDQRSGTGNGDARAPRPRLARHACDVAGTRSRRSTPRDTARSRPTCAASALPTSPTGSISTRSRSCSATSSASSTSCGVDRVHVVGHDWGAAIAWVFATLAPDRVASAHRAVGRATRARSATRRWPSARRAGTCSRSSSRASPSSGCRRTAGATSATASRTRKPTRSRSGSPNPADLTATLNLYRANVPPEALLGGGLDLPPVAAPAMGVWSDGDRVPARAADDRFGASTCRGPWRYETHRRRRPLDDARGAGAGERVARRFPRVAREPLNRREEGAGGREARGACVLRRRPRRTAPAPSIPNERSSSAPGPCAPRISLHTIVSGATPAVRRPVRAAASPSPAPDACSPTCPMGRHPQFLPSPCKFLSGSGTLHGRADYPPAVLIGRDREVGTVLDLVRSGELVRPRR